MQRSKISRWIVIGCLMLICAPIRADFLPLDSTKAAKIDELFQLVEQRLAVMKDVASHKWRQKLGIEDLAREQVVLSKAVAAAGVFRLDPAASERFFSVQITAAKEIQRGWFKHWRRQGAPTAGPDLNNDIRPLLVDLGDQILQKLAIVGPAFASMDQEQLQHRYQKSVSVEYLSEKTSLHLLSALQDVGLVHLNRLQKILHKGVIRIGTTGDYAPFTFLDPATGVYSGIDIDLAQDLSTSLQVELQWVPTTWPTLSQDFLQDKFDIAVGGVSINLKRARLGLFSAPYHSGGKTPIARCSDSEKFDSLEKIDRKATRVIVNPGGTNHRFARSQLAQAQVRVFDDNQKIFDEITNGRADVMITDAIEVMLQSNRYDELCATMPGSTFTKSQKGYWIQPDVHLKEYVDHWLHQRQVEGVVERIFSKHLGTLPLTVDHQEY